FVSFQLRDDGRIYMFANFNGTTRKIRTTNPLKLLKLYNIGLGIDFDSVAGGNALLIFQVYINGYAAAIETTAVDPEYPPTDEIDTYHAFIGSGNMNPSGAFLGQLYAYRYYEEDISSTNMQGLMTNKFTTYNIERGHVLKSNLTKLPNSTVSRFIYFPGPIITISDFFQFTLTDVIKTGRFTSSANLIPISDDFDFFTAPSTSLGSYAIDLTNTSSIHSWVEIPTIDPVKDHFSFFAWVKYRGKIGDWAGIVSAIDGLDNANRLLMTATKIRWHGQFGSESSPMKNFEVTVPSMTGAYHLIGFTYDGDK